MAMTPAYALAHVFLPNLMKLRGATAIVSAIERREQTFFEPVWNQAFVPHKPFMMSTMREPSTSRDAYRIGVVSLPPPQELGEAHYAGFVVRKNDAAFAHYFTLEHDYVLKTKSHGTLLCERAGQKHTKHEVGPALTGSPQVDVTAFIDLFMARIIPTKVDAYRAYR